MGTRGLTLAVVLLLVGCTRVVDDENAFVAAHTAAIEITTCSDIGCDTGAVTRGVVSHDGRRRRLV